MVVAAVVGTVKQVMVVEAALVALVVEELAKAAVRTVWVAAVVVEAVTAPGQAMVAEMVGLES